GPDRRLGEPEPAYRALKRLADGRRLGELKRILYVGVTRARRQLFLSGLARNTQDGLKAPEGSALAWILDHTAREQGGLIPTFLNPPGPEVSLEKDKRMLLLPSPMPFEPQPVPYHIEVPSELGDRSLLGSGHVARGDSDGYHAAIRGTVTHRLIESLCRKGELPGVDRIATALASEGMNPDQAAAMAPEIEAELRACQDEPFFKWLLDCTHPGAKSEWAMETLKQPGMIQAGILDFARQDGDHWWIVDFKTSRPDAGEGEANFLKQEADRYRFQLVAYRDMLAKARGIDPAQIKVGLYFTSIQKWYEVAQDG
ncbi:MAG: PD-(D/E)XK nuclease family protein, partial [Desulfobacterales bacterium]|nr:PD-(D/E)XK nuclease family protein [Desulfobacterales bacterium]